MDSGNSWFAKPDSLTAPATPAHDDNSGTPLYDELAATYSATSHEPADLTPERAPEPHADSPALGMEQLAAVLDLFTRMKKSEHDDGGRKGGDVVELLVAWFDEYGIDVSADEMSAAQSLHLPVWLAQMLAVSMATEPDLVIHLRTDSEAPLDAIRAHLGALVTSLGGGSSAAVFDASHDQIAHIVHPGSDQLAH